MSTESVPRLLVVDDDDDLRQVIARRLQHRGFSVQTATNGDDALEKIKAELFDLVLLDHNMPGLTGMELLRLLRATHSRTDLPIVLLTAQSDSANVVKALELGANDYITKPFDFDIAVARVRAQLERKAAEESLRTSEERYALAARAANHGLWDWDLRRNRLHYSARWKSIVGCTDEEVTDSPEEWHGRVHPDDREDLMAALNAHWRGETEAVESEHRLMHKDGAYRWVHCRGVAASCPGMGVVRMAGAMTDITASKVNDPLTGLPNRSRFAEVLSRVVDGYRQNHTGAYAVLFLDLDHFKWINDTLGHSTGDEVICQVATRLRRCLPDTMIARMGGDEFAILLEEHSSQEGPLAVAERIRMALDQPYVVGDRPISITVSIGVTVSSADGQSPNDVLRDADMALFDAKQKGRARVELLDEQVRHTIVVRLELEKEIRHALGRGEIEVFFQPVAQLSDGSITGLEALARWRHPSRGLIWPADFIPSAEKTGAIIAVGAYILSHACARVSDWLDRFPTGPLQRLGVNVTTRQLLEPGFVETVTAVLKETGLRPGILHLEMPESALLANPEVSQVVFGELKRLGVHLDIADFGTGPSALSQLARYPLDGLKIDRSFTAQMEHGEKEREIVRSLLGLAKVLQLEALANGVETVGQANALLRMGCALGQGFHFGKPMACGEIESILRRIQSHVN